MRYTLLLLTLLLLGLGCDSYAPADDDILVVSGRLGETQRKRNGLYRVSRSGEITELFSEEGEPTGDVACAREGRRIAYERFDPLRREPTELWYWEGGRSQPVARDADGKPLIGRLGSWAPDGRHLTAAVPCDEPGCSGTNAVVVDVERGEVSYRLADFELGSVTPYWEPDGDRIAFVATSGEERRAIIVGADGSGLRDLVPVYHGETGPQQVGSPFGIRWGPGPGQVTYGGLVSGLDTQRWIVDVETADARPLLPLFHPDGQTYTESLAWSPDGKMAAYIVTRQNSFPARKALVLYDVVTEEGRLLYERTTQYDTYIAWCSNP